MSFLLRRGDERFTVDVPDARTVRDLLNASEAAAIDAGALVAVVDGTLLPIDGAVRDGSTIELRPPRPREDLAPWLIRVNSAGERVRVAELMEIRAFEEARGTDVWGTPLDQIRAGLHAWRAERGSRVSFFVDSAARDLARSRLGPGRGRPLRGLGAAA